MTKDTLQFRSRRERENEIDLVRNYRDIGHPAIAAASQAARKAVPAPAMARRAEDQTLIAAE
ncbi:hypothetical protein [Jiella mangrovi]|uniref:Transcriptional regulator n=1 Tax=Jiella mangrovi TaxID=2821407 RepID=A0ABS4BBY3_9HYPH|nr:hypothetical protein [Jiella mangrovi]MBP0614267.1 hypothetical protein [Jiella mangrovi]